MNNVLKETETKVYVNSKELKKLGVSEILVVSQQATNTGKEIVVLENFPNTSPFCVRAKLPEVDDSIFNLLDFGGYDQSIAALIKNVKVTLEEIHHIIMGVSGKGTIYVCPEAFNKTALEKFSLKKNGISLKHTWNNGTVGLKVAKSIFFYVIDFWRSEKKKEMPVNLRRYQLTIEAKEDYIQVGCQRIERFEAEAIAIHYGWMLPNGELVE